MLRGPSANPAVAAIATKTLASAEAKRMAKELAQGGRRGSRTYQPGRGNSTLLIVVALAVTAASVLGLMWLLWP